MADPAASAPSSVPSVSVPSVPSLPRKLQVEVTAACNLRCQMCLVRYRPPVNRVTGSMKFTDFARLVDSLPDLASVILQGLGEPLLAPDLVAMVAYASGRGIRVGFNTNGTLLTKDKARALVDAGLDWLYVSLDGATAETYESIRGGARFGKVRANIENLLEVRRASGATRPEVRLVFVAMRRNVAELPALVNMAADWGVDAVSVQNLSHSFDDTSPESAYQEIRDFTAGEALWGAGVDDPHDAEGDAAFAEARRTADERGLRLTLPRLEEQPQHDPEPRGCDWPWGGAYVLHDGTVQPCCMVMGSDRAVLGNARDEGFPAVWEGAAYREFRTALTTTEPPAVCRGCSLYRGVF